MGPHLLEQNHQTTTNAKKKTILTLQWLDVFRLNRLWEWGQWIVALSYSSSTPWKRKKSVVRFHGFLPKAMTSWDCGSYFWFKKFTKLKADQISGLKTQSFWNNQFIDLVKMHYNVFWYFLINSWCIALLYHIAVYICLIFANRRKETIVENYRFILQYQTWPFSSVLFHRFNRLKYDMK